MIVSRDILGFSVAPNVRRIMEVNGFYPEIVGEFQVVGACERCEAPIFELDNYGYCNIDSTLMCQKCLDETTESVDG